jgi:hypothetical protein
MLTSVDNLASVTIYSAQAQQVGSFTDLIGKDIHLDHLEVGIYFAVLKSKNSEQRTIILQIEK